MKAKDRPISPEYMAKVAAVKAPIPPEFTMPDQRPLRDQLTDLLKLANERKMYDADWLKERLAK